MNRSMSLLMRCCTSRLIPYLDLSKNLSNPRIWRILEPPLLLCIILSHPQRLIQMCKVGGLKYISSFASPWQFLTHFATPRRSKVLAISSTGEVTVCLWGPELLHLLLLLLLVLLGFHNETKFIGTTSIIPFNVYLSFRITLRRVGHTFSITWCWSGASQ